MVSWFTNQEKRLLFDGDLPCRTRSCYFNIRRIEPRSIGLFVQAVVYTSLPFGGETLSWESEKLELALEVELELELELELSLSSYLVLFSSTSLAAFSRITL